MCVVVAVRVERGAVFVEFIRVDFAVMVGEREHFVAGEFDSARLMHVHMSGGGRHHARIRWGDGVDDDLVGLSAADEEEDFGVRACAGLADFGFGAFADVVGAVAGILVGRGFGETGDDFAASRRRSSRFRKTAWSFLLLWVACDRESLVPRVRPPRIAKNLGISSEVSPGWLTRLERATF